MRALHRLELGLVTTLVVVSGARPALAGGPTLPPQISRVYPDVYAAGIEVTQGVQSTVTSYYDSSGALSPDICANDISLPERDFSDSGITKALTYQGVDLERKRTTVVRVFAHARTTNAPVAGVTAVLYGYRDGTELSGSPLAGEEGERDVKPATTAFTTCLERADPKGAFTFTLPDSWAKGTITLKARVLPDRYLFGDGGECAGTYCADDNTLELDDVPFIDTGYVNVTPVQLYYTDPATKDYVLPPSPEEMLANPTYAAPVKIRYHDGDETTYAGAIDITDVVTDPKYAVNTQDNRRAQCDDIAELLEDWGDDNPHGDITFGAFNPKDVICLGVSGGTLLDDGYAYPVVTQDSLTHEMGHNFGRQHSDPPSSGCGGEGEEWLPDERGEMHGIGTDTRDGSGGSAGIYKIIVHGKLTPGDPFGLNQDSIIYDLMSYCGALDRRTTLSDAGWNEAFTGVRSFMEAFHPGRFTDSASSSSLRRRAAARLQRQAAGPVLRVRVAAEGDTARLLGVRRLVAPQPLRRGPSPFTAVFKGPRGGVLGVVPMTGRTHDLHSQATPYVAAADLPLGSVPVASVEIHRGDTVVAARARSPHPPTVTLTAPAAGQTLGRAARTVTVGWTAADADGDALHAAVDYSRGGGTGWRHVFSGPSTGSVALPRRMLGRSAHGRLRVRVSDGFNEAAAVSSPFVVRALPPILRLDTRRGTVRMRAGTRTHVHASVTPASGQTSASSAITWSEHGHVIARGAELSAKLPPGVHHVTTSVISGQLHVVHNWVISIVTSPAHVLSYSGPRSLPARATSMTFKIATTQSATLHVGTQAFPVGPTSTSITIPVTQGATDLVVPATITTGGHTTTTSFVVPRS